MTGMRDTPAVFAFAPVRSFLTDSVCVREDQALPTKLTTTVHREVVSVQISRNNEEVGQQHSEQLTAAFLTEQLGNLRLRVTFRRVIGEHTVLDLPACASSDVLVQGQQHAAMHCNTLQHTATHCNTQGDDRHSLQPVPRTVGALHHVQGSVGISVLQCVTVCCSVLQCVAACCSVLQCVAVCCSVLQ